MHSSRTALRFAKVLGNVALFSALAVGAQAPLHVAQIDTALLAKAQAGDAAAQISVGEAFVAAPGKAQDCKQAEGWYLKAATQGNLKGVLHLAALYRDGCKTLPRDMAQAASWFRKAAEHGDVFAQATLGSLYSMGQGVERDYSEAYFWLDLAASAPGPKQEFYATNRQMMGAHLTIDQLEAVKDRLEAWKAAHPRK